MKALKVIKVSQFLDLPEIDARIKEISPNYAKKRETLTIPSNEFSVDGFVQPMRSHKMFEQINGARNTLM